MPVPAADGDASASKGPRGTAAVRAAAARAAAAAPQQPSLFDTSVDAAVDSAFAMGAGISGGPPASLFMTGLGLNPQDAQPAAAAVRHGGANNVPAGPYVKKLQPAAAPGLMDFPDLGGAAAAGNGEVRLC